jgi:hypothetical protein
MTNKITAAAEARIPRSSPANCILSKASQVFLNVTQEASSKYDMDNGEAPFEAGVWMSVELGLIAVEFNWVGSSGMAGLDCLSFLIWQCVLR